MSKHTPGPLTIKGPSKGRGALDDGGDYAILDRDGKIIAETYRLVETDDERPALANALLFRAAPDLLEACKELVAEADEPIGWAGHPHKDTAGFDFARAAIAKAEGRS